MGIINRPVGTPYVPGTVIRSAVVNADFNTLYNEFNGNINFDNISLTNGHILMGNALGKAQEISTLSGVGGTIPPGGILIFSDYNGTLPFPDATTWHLCNGDPITDVASPLNGIIPEDMTGRYLVGFTTGVEGNGSIGAAGNTNVAVGIAGHTINLQHSHAAGTYAGPSHTHVSPAHSHAGPSHTHTIAGHTHTVNGTTLGAGSHSHAWGSSPNGRTVGMSTTAYEESTDYRIRDDGAGWVNRIAGSRHIGVSAGSNNEGQHDHNIINEGSHSHGLSISTSSTSLTTAASGTAATSSVAATINSSGTGAVTGSSANAPLSSAQTIQPRSVQFRIYVRKI